MFQQNFFDIGQCIYCGIVGKNLTDEHIIPFSLGGENVLKNASCEPCRKITSSYERNPISENWAEARRYLDYPSRRKKNSKKQFSLSVVLKNGSDKALTLEKEELLGITHFLEYPPPGCTHRSTPTIGCTVTAIRTIGFGINLEKFKEIYDVKKIKIETEFKGNHFETMIVRIAYCCVVASWGLDCFTERLVLPTIMGEKDDVGYWMGCDDNNKFGQPIGKINAKNAMKLYVLEKTHGQKLVIVRIKFFANSDAPEYIVIVGTLKEDFKPYRL